MTRSESARIGARASAAQRRAEKAEGMKAARAWRAQHHPVPAFGHMPFAGHRSQAEIAAADGGQARAA